MLEPQGVRERAGEGAVDCLQFDAGLAAYLEREGNPLLAAHAEQCARCGGLLSDLRLVVAGAGRLELKDPPGTVWLKLRAAMVAEGLVHQAATSEACRAFDAAVSAYLEGDGTPDVIRHADECAFCNALLSDLQLLVAEAGHLELKDPPGTVWVNLRAALIDERLIQAAPASEACRAFCAAVWAYLEGDAAPAVVSHAAACAFCGVLLSDLKLLVAEAGRLELRDPPPRVWANIRASLAAEGLIHERVNPWTGWLRRLEFLHPAPVAAMAGMIFLGVLLLGGPRLDNHNQPQGRSMLADEPALLQTQQEVGQLERSYRAHEAALAPEVKADFTRSLASLDSSIQEAEHSIGQGPESSSVAREYLQGAYLRKAELLSSALEYADR